MTSDHIPVCVRLAVLPDEVPYLDTDAGQWYGVKDGDFEEWRNIRPLGIFTGEGETGRWCDVWTAAGPFADRVVEGAADIARERDAAVAERDQLLRAAANIGVERLIDADGKFVGSAGAVTRSAASLMVAAVRMHGPKVTTGIVCDVDVDGRNLEVIAQWSDAPARVNAVSFAASVFKAVTDIAERTGVPRGESEQPIDWLARAVGQVMDERHTAQSEVNRLRARVRLSPSDIERHGVTIEHVKAWLTASPNWTRTDDGSYEHGVWHRDGVGIVVPGLSLIDTISRIACGEPHTELDVLDEMAATLQRE